MATPPRRRLLLRLSNLLPAAWLFVVPAAIPTEIVTTVPVA